MVHVAFTYLPRSTMDVLGDGFGRTAGPVVSTTCNDIRLPWPCLQ